jgi:hypothetical protein
MDGQKAARHGPDAHEPQLWPRHIMLIVSGQPVSPSVHLIKSVYYRPKVKPSCIVFLEENIKAKRVKIHWIRALFGRNVVAPSVDMPRLRHSVVDYASFGLLSNVPLLLSLTMPFWLLVVNQSRR